MKKKRLNVTIYGNDTKKINFDDLIIENIKEHDPNWSQIPDHPYRDSGSGKKQIHFLI